MATTAHELQQWALEPTIKISRFCSRVVELSATEEALQPLLSEIPVTRVSDLSPLDPSRLPCYSVTTPLARDLTTHMGKGLDAQSARLSALMEALERTSAETVPAGRTRRASYEDLCRQDPLSAVDPRSFTLPPDTSYTPGGSFTWVQSVDLSTRREVWLPADLVLSPPSEGLLRHVDTNGLASGNTRLEAVVHGLCEVIERDAQSQQEFAALFCDPEDAAPRASTIRPETLPETAREWRDRFVAQGLDLRVEDITTDIGVATLRATLTDFGYPTSEGPRAVRFGGWGAAANAVEAVTRSITEAAQSRLGYMQAARDSFNVSAASRRAAFRARGAGDLQPRQACDFGRLPSRESDDLSVDLDFLQTRLQAAGFSRIFATDLSPSATSLAVVRVRVPGLSAFYVNRRRVDWRCLRHLL